MVTALGLWLAGCSTTARDDLFVTTAVTVGDAGTTGAPDLTTSGHGSEGDDTGTGGGTGGGGSSEGDDSEGLKLDVAPPVTDVAPMTGEDCELLTATIRDFSHNHPDFETFTGTMAYTGLVLPALGGDGTPQLDPAYAGAPMITSAETFAQWYHDVPGTNFTFEIELALTDEGTGEMIFDSAAFFPINGFGFGNEGFPDNFHFTTEVNTSFTYQGGEVFTFRGDDDIWVFVDGQLALDLGGLHPPLQASIEMDTLGLVPGQTYDMDIFHAERHTDQSNFRIVTTISCFEPPG
ncbi:MAG: fibro-slime domain-containing protein [Myxococcales bacterium]|nr:fibro-slime domain-containing protein [Myxococcales bacterium]